MPAQTRAALLRRLRSLKEEADCCCKCLIICFSPLDGRLRYLGRLSSERIILYTEFLVSKLNEISKLRRRLKKGGAR